MKAEGVIHLRHESRRNDPEDRANALDRHRADLLRLSLRIHPQPGLIRRQGDLKG